MERTILQKRLELVERHVTEGAERIRRQHELHGEMVRDDHPKTATEAAVFLRELQSIQAVFVADRDRLLKMLGET